TIMMGSGAIADLSYTNLPANSLFVFGSRRFAMLGVCGNTSRLYSRVISRRNISRLLKREAGPPVSSAVNAIQLKGKVHANDRVGYSKRWPRKIDACDRACGGRHAARRTGV